MFCKGPLISSYAVNDRTQVAEIDPSLLIEELDEPEFPPCSRCGQDDNEEVLMICDGCEQSCHTYCADLDAVPSGAWFCDECLNNRAAEPVFENSRRQSTRPTGTRTRAQVRRARRRDQSTSSDWARVWQAVSDRAGFDLDFPHEAHGGYISFPRARNNGRRRQAWERRLQVAERQGASNRFREGAYELFDRPTVSRPRPEPPEPESFEEVLAWNAFEKARDIQADPTPKSRKRKSTTTSPSEPDPERARKRRKSRTASRTASPPSPLPAPQPERRLKRPQTRRAFDINDALPDVGEASSSRRRSMANGHSPEANGNAPSFLQSLLKEVETSAIPDEPSTASASNVAASDHPSPGLSSPGGSPTASNHPSPRAMSATPPPMSARSNSPAPLTSKVEPIFPAAPLLSDPPAIALPQSQYRHRSSKSQTRVSRWALQSAQSSSPPRPRSEESSPTRMTMPLSTKERIQKLVKEALKLPYLNKQIDKDQYTAINRNVSRMLYDRVGEQGDVNGRMNEIWKKLAFEEVHRALTDLQSVTT